MAIASSTGIFQPDVRAPLPLPEELPQSLLYAIAANIGGIGLPMTAHEGLLAAEKHGILKKAIGYANQQNDVPAHKIQSLDWHPVRLLANFSRDVYYGARKHYLDHTAARSLASGSYDCFHGWSGDSLRTLIRARQKKIPSLIEIPTWHRNKFRHKKFFTQSERNLPDHWRRGLQISRQQMVTEYRLATMVLVQSEMAAASFLSAGHSPETIGYVGRGVDPDYYFPGTPPDHFRLIFVGSLKKRKGVHHLLDVWKKIGLKDAELVLAGHPAAEMKPWLDRCLTPTVKLLGFTNDVRSHLQNSTAFVFASECEGSAKATYEAAACGLPQITTRESGDIVQHGMNGVIIPANDPDALADAILDFYQNPEKLAAMRLAARERVVSQFTWQHHRRRLLHCYAHAKKLASRE